jgi:uncharacterized membrane protein YphA (DoxX/SURF4 family)
LSVFDVRVNKSVAAWRGWQCCKAFPWLAVVARVLVGGLFVLAGFSKLLLPHAEVMALMQQYTVIPAAVIPLLATVLPWLELVSGTALLIGWFTTAAALVVGGQLVAFSALMVVVLLAGIPIEDCGCFGNVGLHETPLQVLLRDLVMLLLLITVLGRQRDLLALDAWGGSPTSEAPR